MKIAQITPYYYPHIGGVEYYVKNISSALKDRGHKITIYTSHYGKEIKRTEKIDGIKVKRIKQLVNIFSTPVTPNLKSIIKGSNFDIYHSHAPPPLTPYYVVKGLKNRDKPHVLTYHCDLELPTRLGFFMTNIYRHTYGNYTLKNVDEIFVSTETYAATSRSVWKHNAKVIPLGVDTERFHPGVQGKRIRKKFNLGKSKVVMFVGRLTLHKGVQHLIDAAGIYRKAKYLIVGSGPKESYLKKRAAASPNRKNIIFTGKATDDQLPEYYGACDLLVLPSVSRLEAFGLVMLEALSSGKPVVTSDMPGMREVVVDGVDGYLAEPLDPRDIATKIEKVFSDPENARKLGEAGRRKVVDKFTWPRIAELVEARYLKVMDRARSQ
jgi:glycosyltransferase involved in cell wall biosynthesis